MLAYLPVLSPVMTLIAVMFGVFLQNRHVDAILKAEVGRLEAITRSDIGRLETVMRSEIGRLEAVIKSESATLRLDIQRMENRIKNLDERAGVVVHP